MYVCLHIDTRFIFVVLAHLIDNGNIVDGKLHRPENGANAKTEAASISLWKLFVPFVQQQFRS